MGNGLTVQQKTGVIQALNQGQLGEMIKPLVNEIHLFDTYVAGTTYLSDRSVLDEIAAGDKLTLQRENSKFDDNAILVLTGDGKKLGYVPERDNIVFSRLMDAGKCLEAKIAGVDKKGDYTKISIGIYLIDF